uniref:Reverse transcriptase domain-containing protein n=1 Tax=Acrobeloides nanus TaxID=290746 RepID=A0A914DSX4_9BILA
MAYLKPILSVKEHEELEQDMKKIFDKYSDLTLKINAEKCKAMLLAPSSKQYGLGLCYKDHVSRITTKCKQVTGALCRTTRKWAPKEAFQKLYKTTIEPMLTYAIGAWYPLQKSL